MNIQLCTVCNGTGLLDNDNICEYCKGYGRLATKTYSLTVTLDNMHANVVIAADTLIFNTIHETETNLRDNKKHKDYDN